MTTGQNLQLLFLSGCIVMIGLCCAAEAAYVSAGRAGVRAAAKNGNARAALADRLLRDRTGLLAQLLIGVNLFTVCSGVVTTSLSHELWGPAGPVMAAPAVVGFILVFAEITPKRLAYRDPVEAAIRLAPLAAALGAAFRPMAAWFTNLPLWLARSASLGADGIDAAPETLAELLRMAEEGGSLPPDAGGLVLGIRASGARAVREMMVPVASVGLVPWGAALTGAAAIMAGGELSHLPVAGDDGRIVGLLHARDVAARLAAGGGDGEATRAGEIARPVLRVADSTPARGLLGEMRRRRQHLAVVTGGDGRTLGLITMNDLIGGIAAGNPGPEAPKTQGRSSPGPV